ncbi:hypothetical protein [Prosthecobacter sp.]|uniref:hypothetical protein n=1 Tax=Prosthecobacter sp. TaxID=1965333 RepID=UPI003783923C
MVELTSSLEFDDRFRQIGNLAWLPWVGINFSSRKPLQRLLIVGESHYFGEVTEERYIELLQSHKEDAMHTRHAFDEFMLKRKCKIKTYENIPRLLMSTDRFDRDRFWQDTAFYNFIQAANSFNLAVNQLGFPGARIQMTGKVGACHGRSAMIQYEGNSTELIFVKHLGSRMSPLAWHQHLRKRHPAFIEWLDAEKYCCLPARALH